MISKVINLSTGPVGITREVRQALHEAPISHRSADFTRLYNKTTALLSTSFNVKHSFLLTGSGTMANEAMLQEIKQVKGTGLILSNGEFGERLIAQSQRNGLQFTTCQLPWGERFDMDLVGKMLLENNARWILFCHCETSTGIINKLDALNMLAKRHRALCFADCMSTVGTMAIDLSGVTMASASSGKGLASVPGIGIVFSNITPSPKMDCPVYLDLGHYEFHGGVPFTLSSNLLKPLYVSIRQKLQPDQYALVQDYGQRFFQALHSRGIAPFSDAGSKVFTLVDNETTGELTREFSSRQIVWSSESQYLLKRGWSQLAMLGYYTEAQLRQVLRAMQC
jgi:aspartate aminotransferase-like enzyme